MLFLLQLGGIFFFSKNNNWNSFLHSSFFLSRNHTPISLAFFICCARFSSFACYFSPPALFQVFCYLHSVTENVGKIDFVVVCALCFGNNNQSFCKFFKVLERKVNFFSRVRKNCVCRYIMQILKIIVFNISVLLAWHVYT